MTKVWWVEDGEYSDYRVCGVFSSEENAELYAKTFGGEVVEVDLDPDIPRLREGYAPYSAAMTRDGISHVWERDSVVEHRSEPVLVPPHKHNFFPWSNPNAEGSTSYLSLRGWYKSKEHLVKVLNEKRVQLIASGEWPPDPPKYEHAWWAKLEAEEAE